MNIYKNEIQGVTSGREFNMSKPKLIRNLNLWKNEELIKQSIGVHLGGNQHKKTKDLIEMGSICSTDIDNIKICRVRIN